jgi:hypothetical protein
VSAALQSINCARLSILAFFRARSTSVRTHYEFHCSAVLIAQHVGVCSDQGNSRMSHGSAAFLLSVAATNRILAILARCASMSFSKLALLESDLLQKPGLSRESERSRSCVHKTF